jgi:threonine/homoserine/homoserine lactone efflux protein
MFRALLTHLQEALHILVILCACYVSWLHLGWSSTPILVQPTDITRTQYNKCRYWSAS